MISHLDPLSVGFDWEMALLRDTAESVGDKEIQRFANELRRKLPWSRVGVDIDLLEARLGIAYSYQELVQRNTEYWETARNLARKKGFIIVPIGARPTEEMPIGSHIHVGTVTDMAGAVALANAMMSYVPILVAIMANSPFYRSRSGEFKSYRVATNAEGCSWPQSLHHPILSMPGWGEDVCVKYPWKPTVELRCGDSVSLPDLMCECSLLGAGVMYTLSIDLSLRFPTTSSELFRWNSINRWRASRHGLQAMLFWDGEERPVSELVVELIDLAEPGIRILGADSDDLATIRCMASKRQTQADFVTALGRLDQDPHRLLRTLATVLQDSRAFHRYLDVSPVLPPIEPGDLEEYFLSKVTRDVTLHQLCRFVPLSPQDLEALLLRLENEGKVRSRLDEYWGRLYTRTTDGGAQCKGEKS